MTKPRRLQLWTIPSWVWIPDDRRRKGDRFTTHARAIESLLAIVAELAAERHPDLAKRTLPWLADDHRRYDETGATGAEGRVVSAEEPRIVGRDVVVTLRAQYRYTKQFPHRAVVIVDGVEHASWVKVKGPVTDWIPEEPVALTLRMDIDREAINLVGELGELEWRMLGG